MKPDDIAVPAMLAGTSSGAAAGATMPPLFADLKGDIDVSFEFFPPSTPALETSLWQTVETLIPLAPRFVSVTYGAGGSTRDRTHALIARLLKETPLVPAAHLTCAAASRDEIASIARDYWAMGVRHIVALRGDGPEGKPFEAHPQGYRWASELVEGLARVAPFEISVAAYPEKHPEAASLEADIDNLKRKLDAGATRAITQFFFSPELFLRFRDLAAKRGVTAPIVPGILPVTNFNQVKKFAAMCGASIPPWFARLFEGLDASHAATRQLIAATLAAELCRNLYEAGVREFHFYTLNRAELSHAIAHLLGLRPKKVGTA